MSNTKILAKDIHVKWSKLNEADLTNVKSHDALSALVVKGTVSTRQRRMRM